MKGMWQSKRSLKLQRDHLADAYDTLCKLLRRRFPQRADGSFPDYKIEDVLRENEALRADRERLDWAEDHIVEIWHHGCWDAKKRADGSWEERLPDWLWVIYGGVSSVGNPPDGNGATLRAAIDNVRETERLEAEEDAASAKEPKP